MRAIPIFQPQGRRLDYSGKECFVLERQSCVSSPYLKLNRQTSRTDRASPGYYHVVGLTSPLAFPYDKMVGPSCPVA